MATATVRHMDVTNAAIALRVRQAMKIQAATPVENLKRHKELHRKI